MAGCASTTCATPQPAKPSAGENLPLVGKLLGLKRHRTAAYAHVGDAHLVAAAERVGTAIAEAMARGASR